MKLKEWLDKRALKHCAFAAKLGLKRSAFCRYVNGSRKPPVEIVKKIKTLTKNEVTEFDFIIEPLS
jgi:hypothetical protein